MIFFFFVPEAHTQTITRLGVFHSGVEIGGKEYCFGGHEIPNVTGVFVVEPRIGIPELSLK